MIDKSEALVIILAICAAWVTLFATWFLLVMIRLVRRAHNVLDLIERKVDLVERSVGAMRAKFENGTPILGTIAEVIKRVVDITKRRREDD